MISEDQIPNLLHFKELLSKKIHKLKSQLKAGSDPPQPQCIIDRIKVEIPTIEPLLWLNKQPHISKTYWSSRDGSFEMAGVGITDQYSGDSKANFDKVIAPLLARLARSEDAKLRYFGGISFSLDKPINGYWKYFGNFQFILPRFEILKDGNSKTFLIFNFKIYSEDDANQQVELLNAEFSRLNFGDEQNWDELPKVISLEYEPDKVDWVNKTRTLLTQISSRELNKIVLSRKSKLQLSKKLNPISLLRKIKESSSNCFHFCFQVKENLAFIGASPERLYKREKEKVLMEAVAGTRIRGNSPSEDHNFGMELIRSEKDIREHQFVISDLKRAFSELGCSANFDSEVSLLKLNRLQHLYLTVEGDIPKGVSDLDILKSLHPTSAVGGSPTPEALRIINSTETFDRGWYAGPIGWFGVNQSEFSVGIRSGVIWGDKMEVYTGAGIIKESVPEKEWNEIKNKYDSFIGTLLD